MRKIAVVGVTGIVGEKLVDILQSKSIEGDFAFYAGNNGTGEKMQFRNRIYKIKNVAEILSDIPNYAIFVATNEVSQKLIPTLAQQNCVCVDNSSVFRLAKEVPLVIPSVNKDTIGLNKIIANPNCTTIQIAATINALKSLLPTKVVAVTYQAVSGAGREGLNDLIKRNNYGRLKCFCHPIYDNIIPAIGSFTDDGYTEEEHKVINETKKILDLPQLKVNCFAARVPITTAHSAFANIVFEKRFDLTLIRKLLKQSENILLFDDTQNNLYPMPMTARGTPFVTVGRLTVDISQENALNCFITADNLLRGAAYNAYEILEVAINNFEHSK